MKFHFDMKHSTFGTGKNYIDNSHEGSIEVKQERQSKILIYKF